MQTKIEISGNGGEVIASICGIFQTHGQEYLHMIWQHVYLSLLAVAIAAAIGIPCGILCLRVPKVKKNTDHRIQCITYNTKSCGVGYSDSDYGRWCETGFDSVGYSGNPTNLIQTTLAFSQVPAFMLEVADAMGMDKKRKFRQVEVPLAMPGIISVSAWRCPRLLQVRHWLRISAQAVLVF